MVSLPVVLLIVISSNYRDGNKPATVQLPAEKDIKTYGSSGVEMREPPRKEVTSRVNDLTLSDLNLVVTDSTRKKLDIAVKKDEKEPELKEEEPVKKQSPMPLYSLVKNVCEEGYVMDQNGVCQKAVVLKGAGKEFDSDRKRRRRRRHIEVEDAASYRNLKPFFEHLNVASRYRKLLEKFKGNERAECREIHPGLVLDGAGGCRKSDSLEGSGRFPPKWKISQNT